MVKAGEITLLPDTRRVTEGFSYKAARLPKRRKNLKESAVVNIPVRATTESVNQELRAEDSADVTPIPRSPLHITDREDDGYPD
jgi:hypothetical protein